MKKSSEQHTHYYVRVTGDVAEAAADGVPAYHQSLSRTYTIPAAEFTPAKVAECVNHFCDGLKAVQDLHVLVA